MRAVALLAVVLFAAGCGKQLPPPEEASAAPPAAHTGPALTEDDYRSFGKELEKAVAVGDVAATNRLFRLTDLIDRCVADFGLSPAERREASAAAVRAAASGGLGATLAAEVKRGGKLTAVGPRMDGGQPRLLVRVVGAEGSVNYLLVRLARYPDGGVGVEDADVLSSGEPLTLTLRRTMLTLLPMLRGGPLDRLTGADRAYADAAPVMKQVIEDQRAGRFAEMAAGLGRLPTALQRDKATQLLLLRAVAQSGTDDEYLTAMERFRQLYPDDASFDLLAVDYYLVKKRYDDPLAAVDRLDARIGGDPYLNLLRVNAHAEAGRLAEAKAAAEGAIAGEPTLADGYWARVEVALKERHHADTRDWLKRTVERAGEVLDTDAMRTSPVYAEFVKSDEFSELAAWWASQSKK